MLVWVIKHAVSLVRHKSTRKNYHKIDGMTTLGPAWSQRPIIHCRQPRFPVTRSYYTVFTTSVPTTLHLDVEANAVINTKRCSCCLLVGFKQILHVLLLYFVFHFEAPCNYYAWHHVPIKLELQVRCVATSFTIFCWY